jgi:TolB-like protein/DNA-binding winged helix-turn-helix (wHTH) protein/Tfp pilus assembly protein PilF
MSSTTESGAEKPSPFHVGDWLVEPSLNRLIRGEDTVHLEPRAMDLLVFLARRPGEVLSHQALIDGVWAEQFVGEAVLRQTIAALREALGDDARDPTYIETIPKRGYRLIAPVRGVEQDDTTAARRPAAGRPRWIHALAVAIAAAIALLVVLPPEGIWQRLVGNGESTPIRSIVVLPLDNLSDDPEQEYFADGMTDELITELAKIGGFQKVISSTTCMRYRDTEKTSPEIGRELGVDAILEGSVLRDGDQVRINAQLIHASSDAHLWAHSYTREIADVIGLQRDLALAIASAIHVELTAADQARLSDTRAVDPDAYEAYLMGLYHWNRYQTAGFSKAREYFERAIAIDPGYAPAYAGLANAYWSLAGWKALPPETAETAREYAFAALEMDSTLSDAHVVIAHVNAVWDWDPVGAEDHIRRAIELGPSSSLAHASYATFLFAVRRYDEALDVARRAFELDPLNINCRVALAQTLGGVGRHEEKIELHHEMLEMVPNHPSALYGLYASYAALGRHDEALEVLDRFGWGQKLATEEQLEAYREARSTRGWTGAMEWIALYRESLDVPEYRVAYQTAAFFANAGRLDKAMHWLERAYQAHDFQLGWVKAYPVFEPLHSDPRFQDLLRRMNFPEP